MSWGRSGGHLALAGAKSRSLPDRVPVHSHNIRFSAFDQDITSLSRMYILLAPRAHHAERVSQVAIITSRSASEIPKSQQLRRVCCHSACHFRPGRQQNVQRVPSTRVCRRRRKQVPKSCRCRKLCCLQPRCTSFGSGKAPASILLKGTAARLPFHPSGSLRSPVTAVMQQC